MIKVMFIFYHLWALILGSQGSYPLTFYPAQNDWAKPQSMGPISAPSTCCTSASRRKQ